MIRALLLAVLAAGALVVWRLSRREPEPPEGAQDTLDREWRRRVDAQFAAIGMERRHRRRRRSDVPTFPANVRWDEPEDGIQPADPWTAALAAVPRETL